MFHFFNLLALALFIVFSTAAIAQRAPLSDGSFQIVAGDEQERPLVLACYYPWYAAPHGGVSDHFRGWAKDKDHRLGTDATEMIFDSGMRNISAGAYPLIGTYDSRQKEVARWHVELAKAAGIDGFLISWWGPGSWQTPKHLTRDGVLDALLPAAEESGDFVIALMDEVPQFTKEPIEKQAAWAKEYLAAMKDSTAYLKINGKPFYGIYQLWEGKMTPESFTEFRENVEQEHGEIYWMMTKLRADAEGPDPEQWWYYFPEEWVGLKGLDMLGAYSTFSNGRAHTYELLAPRYKKLASIAHGAEQAVMLPVHPGLDNRKFNKTPFVIPRENGDSLRGYYRAADESNADIILITSFNEWPETTVIEPAITWPDPYQYLKVVAELQGVEFSAPPLPPEDEIDPAILPLLRARIGETATNTKASADVE